ncbi:MAG: hypothetical protein LBE35_10715 [Clostridiales bacterium]|nr:hypothetical protein [Clostridiales bacterium]
MWNVELRAFSCLSCVSWLNFFNHERHERHERASAPPGGLKAATMPLRGLTQNPPANIPLSRE